MWYRPTVPNVPQSNFRIAATTDVNLGPGRYVVRTISDDAVRLWVDDRLVIDNWKPHESEVNLADISSGNHKLRVEYYQLGGWVELRVEILRDPAHSQL
jgi:alpha-L-fucosidase